MPDMSFRRRFSGFRERLGAPRDELPLVFDQPDGLVRPLLVCGLGNPGAQYGNTRHNVGAWCINLLARRHHVELKREGRVDRARIEVAGHQFEIARPRAFMNVTGPPIAAEVKRLRIRPEHLLVIYDDLDLPVGRTRMRLQGSSGGNNGMKSIIGALGSQEFARIRIGIDRPYDAGAPVRDPDRVAQWVLSPPHPEDRRRLEAAVARTVEAIELAASEGLEAAMNWLNRQPDEGSGGGGGAPPHDGDEARTVN
jgi:peptidyl-tRNA hydrolase, PTH1 family